MPYGLKKKSHPIGWLLPVPSDGRQSPLNGQCVTGGPRRDILRPCGERRLSLSPLCPNEALFSPSRRGGSWNSDDGPTSRALPPLFRRCLLQSENLLTLRAFQSHGGHLWPVWNSLGCAGSCRRGRLNWSCRHGRFLPMWTHFVNLHSKGICLIVGPHHAPRLAAFCVLLPRLSCYEDFIQEPHHDR